MYTIYVERGALDKAGDYFDLHRRVLVVTDDGVPPTYAQRVMSRCKYPVLLTIAQGEKSKNLDTFSLVLKTLVEAGFTRTDCVVAVGGGVVGDLTGFAASAYMRGIDFYNIPTTLLSQVDSSVGGKTAVDFMGYKNLVGAFYPPKGVIIDPDTLSTLPPRQLANGMAEAVKMSLTGDEGLFRLFEEEDVTDPAVLEQVIIRSLMVKKQVVETDEHEAGLRKVLNFGHTLAHAIESVCQLDTYYHGECVAMGMVPMCAAEVQDRLLPVLRRLGLPTALPGGADELLAACRHDKKMAGDTITVVTVPRVGTFAMEDIPFHTLEARIRRVTDI